MNLVLNITSTQSKYLNIFFLVAENEIKARLDKLASNCDTLDILVNKEPVARRQNAKL